MSEAKRPVMIVTEDGERREATVADYTRDGLLLDPAEAPLTPAGQVREDLGVAEASLLRAMVYNDDYSMAALLATAWSATTRALQLWHQRQAEAGE